MNKSMKYLLAMSQPDVQSFASLGYDFSGADSDIVNICDDSRAVQPGDTFLCLPRAASLSRDYIQYAIAAGANNIIYIGDSNISSSLPCLNLPNMEQAGAFLRRYFHTDNKQTQCIGITGTDGKTSVAWMLREALEKQYGEAWSSGTLGWVENTQNISDLGNTTPSLLTLHHLLSAADKKQVSSLIMEVSSHGIEQQRIAGLHFDACAWTTLGHDHLQDHGGFDAYALLKKQFISNTGTQGGTVVYNQDQTPICQQLADINFQSHPYSHGLYPYPPQENILTWEQELPGLLRLAYQGNEVVIEDIPVGRFHAENIACVAQLLHSHYQLDLHDIAHVLSGITAPPGRMQPVEVGSWQVFIDYAHTAEALQACLESARLITRGRLLLVFGCGGERDREKRPAMGHVASKFSDVLWISSDNPRHEHPEMIASEIEEGITRPYPIKVHLQLDRQQAIADAIADMNKHDTLIIAGKGHENYMDIKGERIAWSDLECARQCLQQKSSEEALCV